LKKKGHEVTMMSELTIPPGQRPDNDGWKLVRNLEREGISCVEWDGWKCSGYDLILASEPQSRIIFGSSGSTPVFNIIHSEYECESPIPLRPEIKKYIAIRPSIAAHIMLEHAIPSDMVKVIYNGVDRKRFSPGLVKERKFAKIKRILAPCTLDSLREKFLNHLIENASEKVQVVICGMDCGAKLKESPFVIIKPDTFNIQYEMAYADEVAGILLGRVNLEAWSMGLESTIYDPVTLEKVTLPPPYDFDNKHNIKLVARQIIKLYDDLVRG
jgi:hypothetical protein